VKSRIFSTVVPSFGSHLRMNWQFEGESLRESHSPQKVVEGVAIVRLVGLLACVDAQVQQM